MSFKPFCFVYSIRLYLCILLIGFGLNLSAALIYVVNSESRTLSRIDTATDTVQNSFATLGIVPNKVIVDDNYLWCVNSGDNSVQKIDRITGATLANILIENSSNPWDACSEGNFLYVTGLFTHKVYKVHKTSHTVMGSVTVGNSPEALLAYNGKLYVTNTGGYLNNYASSSVSVIDLETFTVTNTIPVSANPQYVIEHNGLLHVSCTGDWVNVLGAVCIIDPVSEQVIQTIALGGALGGIWINNVQQGLVGDGTGYNLYRYDAQNYSILNGADNPISPGGSVVCGDVEITALLYPNWGSAGKVKILHPNLTFWKEYTVGLAPTDMKIWSQSTLAQEHTHIPHAGFKVYPNPIAYGKDINFSFDNKNSGQIMLYDIKGRLLYEHSFSADKVSLSPQLSFSKEVSGFYIYKIKSDKINAQGKLVIFK